MSWLGGVREEKQSGKRRTVKGGMAAEIAEEERRKQTTQQLCSSLRPPHLCSRLLCSPSCKDHGDDGEDSDATAPPSPETCRGNGTNRIDAAAAAAAAADDDDDDDDDDGRGGEDSVLGGVGAGGPDDAP